MLGSDLLLSSKGDMPLTSDRRMSTFSVNNLSAPHELQSRTVSVDHFPTCERKKKKPNSERLSQNESVCLHT